MTTHVVQATDRLANSLRFVDMQELNGKTQVLVTVGGEYNDLVGPDTRKFAAEAAGERGVQRPACDIGALRPYGVAADGGKIVDLQTRPAAYRVDVIINAGF